MTRELPPSRSRYVLSCDSCCAGERGAVVGRAVIGNKCQAQARDVLGFVDRLMLWDLNRIRIVLRYIL